MVGNATDGRRPASFRVQVDALLRKNVTFQRRNVQQVVCLVMFPAFLCGLIVVLQHVVNSQLDGPEFRCGCKCVDKIGNGSCNYKCGIEYSHSSWQALSCPARRPYKWPVLLQFPRTQDHVVDSNASSASPDAQCFKGKYCPVTTIFTGYNKTLAAKLTRKLNIKNFPKDGHDLDLELVNPDSRFHVGTDAHPGQNNYMEPALVSNSPIFIVVPHCASNSSFSYSAKIGDNVLEHEVVCIRGLYSWHDSASIIDKEMYRDHKNRNSVNRILVAYDIQNSSGTNFNVTVWYDSTYRRNNSPRLLRVLRSINMISDAFVQLFGRRGSSIQIDFVKEMPKPATPIALDISSLLGPLLFAWVIQLLLPVILTSLVYEKQQKLRIMMKMHGLGDGPYWFISYCYFLGLSSVYMMWFATFGYLIGLNMFQLNNIGIQFAFFFGYLNLQTALAFLSATVFSKVMTAAGYIYVFGSGLLGAFLFQSYVEDASYPRQWVIAMEVVPAFSLYRGLYELFQYALEGHYKGSCAMSWKDLSDNQNGMKTVLVILVAEWLIMLPLSYYFDKIAFFQKGRKSPFFSLGSLIYNFMDRLRISSMHDDLEEADICCERNVVLQLANEHAQEFPIICHNLGKVYKGRDGNPKKYAVQNLSLAVPKGECFGLLGPSGSGKTTLIDMVTGNVAPSSGAAFIDGINIQTDMDKVYMRMGVCPQHNLIWETLTGREHLLFYARLKNFKGNHLQQVVDQSLKTVNLVAVGERLAGKYSGGMKRRLSVAISLIGDPQVVYLDEPTTGLDPDSRKYLWNVIKEAKKHRAIILTTHSMAEAEHLCDFVGIIVKGNLQCLGSAKELKSRYQGSFLLTASVDPMQETDIIENMVQELSGNAEKVYRKKGMEKFRLPKHEVKFCELFRKMQDAKEKKQLHAFEIGVSSLEDVFIEVVNSA